MGKEGRTEKERVRERRGETGKERRRGGGGGWERVGEREIKGRGKESG